MLRPALVVLLIAHIHGYRLWRRFDQCPQGCDCDTRYGVDILCADSRLSEVPEFHSNQNKATSVAIIEQPISRIKNGAFHMLPVLETLDLYGNKISTIDDHAFVGANWYMERLDLKNNNLGKIPKALTALSVLEYLDLSNNRITKLGQNNITGLAQLRELRLDDNPINEVHRNALNQLPALKELYITYVTDNEIDLDDDDEDQPGLSMSIASQLEIVHIVNSDLELVVKGDFMSQLDNVKSLSIVNSGLRDQHLEKMVSLKLWGRLEELSLENNDFTPHRNAFKDILGKMSNVKTINLARNSIHSLSVQFNQAFSNMANLENLNLQNNGLSYVDPDIFNKASKLRFLDLRDNSLSQLTDNGRWPGLSPNLRLQLGHNPWTCDCSIRWLHELIIGRAHIQLYTYELFETLKCAEPRSLSGKLLKDLGGDFIEDLNCRDD